MRLCEVSNDGRVKNETGGFKRVQENGEKWDGDGVVLMCVWGRFCGVKMLQIIFQKWEHNGVNLGSWIMRETAPNDHLSPARIQLLQFPHYIVRKLKELNSGGWQVVVWRRFSHNSRPQIDTIMLSFLKNYLKHFDTTKTPSYTHQNHTITVSFLTIFLNPLEPSSLIFDPPIIWHLTQSHFSPVSNSSHTLWSQFVFTHHFTPHYVSFRSQTRSLRTPTED